MLRDVEGMERLLGSRITLGVHPHGAPVREVPVLEVPVREVPVLEVPVREVPVLEVPVREVPVREVPVLVAVLAEGSTGGGGISNSPLVQVKLHHFMLVLTQLMNT